ncbi:6995_t:CDS:2, partial [Acaulospora morrowiae]
ADKLRLEELGKSPIPFVRNHPEAYYRSRVLNLSNIPDLPEPINDQIEDTDISHESFIRDSSQSNSELLLPDILSDSEMEISDVEAYLDDIIRQIRTSKKSKKIFQEIDSKAY